jgi:hypothetical protein
MNIRISAAVALLTISGAALAQMPLIYPVRNQSPGQQSVDAAFCYGTANRQTGVNMARESQRPVRTKASATGRDAGHGASAPPLPQGASAAAPASGAATAARGTAPASASGAAVSGASGVAASGVFASGAASASEPRATQQAYVQMPPLPPPEPPMTVYWRAYGDCMHDRGYTVH